MADFCKLSVEPLDSIHARNLLTDYLLTFYGHQDVDTQTVQLICTRKENYKTSRSSQNALLADTETCSKLCAVAATLPSSWRAQPAGSSPAAWPATRKDPVQQCGSQRGTCEARTVG